MEASIKAGWAARFPGDRQRRRHDRFQAGKGDPTGLNGVEHSGDAVTAGGKAQE
ncbi:MAG: hypothetical protein PHQ40_21000 [Anaerolineaceae bacterium]|nr:hypothetical protein [Anaerolineaceae bacterium]MDD5371565.1 hypothetical protein [Anaerolineaceae bacterium]